MCANSAVAVARMVSAGYLLLCRPKMLAASTCCAVKPFALQPCKYASMLRCVSLQKSDITWAGRRQVDEYICEDSNMA